MHRFPRHELLLFAVCVAFCAGTWWGALNAKVTIMLTVMSATLVALVGGVVALILKR